MENVNERKSINFEPLIIEYSNNIEQEFAHLWNSWEIDMNEKEIYEVISGLVARQITMAKQFSYCISGWTGDFAPIILRSLADNFINIAWILKSPLERSRKFIFYGLGREKLNIEHRKIQMEADGIDTKDDPIIEVSTHWINFHQYEFLTNVNVGSWSEKSIYKMAEEADCKGFYNHVYQPFSNAAHSAWNHVGKYNVKKSENPLHNNLLIPRINDGEPHYDYFELAAKYVEKALNAVHNTFGIERHEKNAYSILGDQINNLTNSFYEEE